MSLYRRGTIWWIRFTTPTGQELRESAKRQAQEYHDRRKAELWRVAKLGEKPKFTWKEAVLRWLDENQDQRSLKSTLSHLRQLDEFFGELRLDQITRDHFESFVKHRQAESVSSATINRALASARSILNSALKEWGWIDQAPAIRLLSEPKQRIRWLTKDEADRLYRELPYHLRAMMRFTLATGLREGNVCELRWDQIDLERKQAWIHADQSKGGKAISIPLNSEAMDVLLTLKDQHQTHVFTFEGQPVLRANNHAWRKALRRARIENFRWHDLRHTWASWHVMAGTPMEVLKELGGWSSLEMVLRYAHLSSDHLAKHAERISEKPKLRRVV